MAGIIYYTDCRAKEPIFSIVQKQLELAGLPITSSSLNKLVYFGDNSVIMGKRGYPMMVDQIVSCLRRSTDEHVFFCEHDVLYHEDYFDFIPPEDDVFYYNLNNWRWDYPKDRLIRYEGLTSLSQMCCNRELALDHYKRRQKRIAEIPHEFKSREPHRARAWGYEPGRKPTSNGGFSDDKSATWGSEVPNIDIRHGGTFSPPKVYLSSFRHLPTGWEEVGLDDIKEWDLKAMFDLCT